jgi:hypothetical protein
MDHIKWPMDEKAKAWIEEFRQRVPLVNRAAQLGHEFMVLLPGEAE